MENQGIEGAVLLVFWLLMCVIVIALFVRGKR
jgi:hypothetical protein